MIDLAIARAPHQVLYCAERLADSGHKKVIVLDMFNLENFGNSITKMLEKTEWDTVIKLNYRVKDIRGILKYLFYLLIIKILILCQIKINNLVIGDGNIAFAKLISDNFKHINKRIVIGDGTDFVDRNASSREIRYYCQIGRRARSLLRLFNLKFNDEYQYDELFTYFQVDDDRLNFNSFYYVKGLIEHKSNTIDKNSIYFLGTVGLGNGTDLELIYKKIFGYYPGMTIKYIPHRRETREQIEIVRSIGNATIIDTKGEIVETYFMSNNVIPMRLGSFIGNAVFSLAVLYPYLNIDVFQIRVREENRNGWTEKKFRNLISNAVHNEQIKYRILE